MLRVVDVPILKGGGKDPTRRKSYRPISLTPVVSKVVEEVFSPAPFGAPHPDVASEADGIWVAVPDPGRVGASTRVYKTMVHPDARRSFAGLAVVAIDLRAYELHLVAGTREPRVPEAFGRTPNMNIGLSRPATCRRAWLSTSRHGR